MEKSPPGKGRHKLKTTLSKKEDPKVSCLIVITDLIRMTIMKIYLDNITSLLPTLISLLVLITNIILFTTKGTGMFSFSPRH